MNASLTDYLKSGALYALPHHLISRSVFKLTRLKSPFVPKAIKMFSNAFNVNLPFCGLLEYVIELERGA